MGEPAAAVPGRARVVTAAGTAVNLCLGILYAWSGWKDKLIAKAGVEPGAPMTGRNDGWVYLSDTEGTTAYTVCGLMFALAMIPGGRLQDRYGPRAGATLAGLLLGAGCVVAGLMKSYLGLILGFGLLGGLHATAVPRVQPKAKSVICLFLFGRWSQLETFDMKPDSAADIRRA